MKQLLFSVIEMVNFQPHSSQTNSWGNSIEKMWQHRNVGGNNQSLDLKLTENTDVFDFHFTGFMLLSIIVALADDRTTLRQQTIYRFSHSFDRKVSLKQRKWPIHTLPDPVTLNSFIDNIDNLQCCITKRKHH